METFKLKFPKEQPTIRKVWKSSQSHGNIQEENLSTVNSMYALIAVDIAFT